MRVIWKASLCVMVAAMFLIPANIGVTEKSERSSKTQQGIDLPTTETTDWGNLEEEKSTQDMKFIDKVVPDDGTHTTKISDYFPFQGELNPTVVTVKAVADEEYRYRHGGSWQEDMITAVELGDNRFELSHGINFKVESTGTWNSNDYTSDLFELFDEMRDETSKGSCDFVIGFTGQEVEDYAGVAESLGDDTIVIDYPNYLIDNLIQHEASHLFGCPDHNPGQFRFCVMSYAYSYDTNRWCIPCWLTIELHRWHFGP